MRHIDFTDGGFDDDGNEIDTIAFELVFDRSSEGELERATAILEFAQTLVQFNFAVETDLASIIAYVKARHDRLRARYEDRTADTSCPDTGGEE